MDDYNGQYDSPYEIVDVEGKDAFVCTNCKKLIILEPRVLEIKQIEDARKSLNGQQLDEAIKQILKPRPVTCPNCKKTYLAIDRFTPFSDKNKIY